MSPQLNRRRVLAGAALSLGAFTAGCLGDDDDSTLDDDTDESGTDADADDSGTDDDADGAGTDEAADDPGTDGDATELAADQPHPDDIDECPPESDEQAEALLPEPDGFTLLESGSSFDRTTGGYEGPDGDHFLVDYERFETAEVARAEAEHIVEWGSGGRTFGEVELGHGIEVYAVAAQYENTVLVVLADKGTDTHHMDRLLMAAECFVDEHRVGGSWE